MSTLDQSRNPSRKQESVEEQDRKDSYLVRNVKTRPGSESFKEARARERKRERERVRVSETWQERSVDFQFLLLSHRGNRTYLCQQIYNHMRFRAINQHSISLRLTVKHLNLNKCI